MAERSKLKATDEILESLGKPGGQVDPAPPEEISPSPRDTQTDDTEADVEQAVTPATGEEDRNPLDFGKYQLPKRGRKRKTPPPDEDDFEEEFAAPMAVEIVGAELAADDGTGLGRTVIAKAGEAEVKAFDYEDLEAEQRERERLEQEARHQLAADEEYIETVMDRLGSQFESVFNREFEQPAKRALPEDPAWLKDRPRPESPPETEPEVLDPAAVEADQEANQFFSRFEEDVRQEERVGDEPFRETLAQKFARERERYLKDLGIAEQMEAEQKKREDEAVRLAVEAEAAERTPPRRRLDFQIQPEMHTEHPPEMPPAPEPARKEPPQPVTYTRNAAVQPQVPVEDAIASLNTAATHGAAHKKSAEELLLELGRQVQNKPIVKAAGPPPDKLKFKFTTPEEEAQETKKKKRSITAMPMSRIVLLSAAACLVVLALGIFGVSQIFSPESGIVQSPEDAGAAASSGDLLELYNSFNAEEQAHYTDVVVRRSGLSVSNLVVDGSLLVEDESTAAGTLSLQNVTVGDLIYVKSGGTNALDLRDVRASRLVVSNSQSDVTLIVNGATDIESVELRTPVTIRNGELGSDAQGLRSVLVKNEGEAAQPLSLSVQESSLTTLTTEGDTLVTFDNAEVVTMSSFGSLSVTGTGRVQNLSAGYNEGGGATEQKEPMIAKPFSILIKGVEVGHLNIKSAANVNLATTVDFVATADSVNLGGDGTVVSLTLNENADGNRLAVEIAGLNVQQLTSNAEATIYSSGSSAINTLIANKSVYALGNKVNHLKANAEGVIYENEPDLKTVATGVEPPQSKAENPNLNYSLNAVTEVTGEVTDATGDSVATTCDHARESGGFLRGNGSKDSPFLIETPAQLAHVAQHPSSHYLQVADIDIADDSSFSGGFPLIGGGGGRFSGVYDGGGHSVANLRITTDGENIGLFAENTGVIRNLNLVSGEISAGERSSAAGIVGFNYQGGLVENCSNGALVNAQQGEYVGGIVGYNYGGKVRNCYNTAKIIGGQSSGGIVGMNRSGSAEGGVSGCYNVGVIEGSGAVGAIAGSNDGAVVTNSYYLDTSADSGIGSGSGTVLGRTSEELAGRQTVADLVAGGDGSPWRAGDAGGYAYPVLAAPDITAMVEAVDADSGAAETEVAATEPTATEPTTTEPTTPSVYSEEESDTGEPVEGVASFEG